MFHTPGVHVVHYPVRQGREIVQDGATFKDPDDKYIYRYLHNELGYVPADKSFGTWVSLQKAGWTTVPGSGPERKVADACLTLLNQAKK